ncbi:hypothetical protein HanIR_Chr12g0567671 [Helianthus annuus]|nr:hypothetical protein HanIR_Chr12g0567671 [Helianthus annuus]
MSVRVPTKLRGKRTRRERRGVTVVFLFFWGGFAHVLSGCSSYAVCFLTPFSIVFLAGTPQGFETLTRIPLSWSCRLSIVVIAPALPCLNRLAGRLRERTQEVEALSS